VLDKVPGLRIDREPRGLRDTPGIERPWRSDLTHQSAVSIKDINATVRSDLSVPALGDVQVKLLGVVRRRRQQREDGLLGTGEMTDRHPRGSIQARQIARQRATGAAPTITESPATPDRDEPAGQRTGDTHRHCRINVARFVATGGRRTG
jgi:hypothetical protein